MHRLQPTPDALRNGRLTLLGVALIELVIAGLMVAVPGFGDAGLFTTWLVTLVTVAGLAIAYLGEPTTARYRIGLVVSVVGMVGAFLTLIAFPWAPGAE